MVRQNLLSIPKAVVRLALALTVIGGSLGGYLYHQHTLTSTGTLHEIVAVAKMGNIQRAVEGTGTVTFEEIQTLTSPGSGTVTAVNVKVGDQVKAGQVLITISSPALQISLAAAQADLAAAQEKLHEALKPYTSADIASAKATLLSAEEALQQAEHPYTPADIASARAAVASAQQALYQAEHPYTPAELMAEKVAVQQAQEKVAAAAQNVQVVEVSIQQTMLQAQQKVAAAKLALYQAQLSRDAAVSNPRLPDYQKQSLDAGLAADEQAISEAEQALPQTQTAQSRPWTRPEQT